MSNSLKINVITIPEEGLDLAFSEDGKWFAECFHSEKPLDISLRRIDVFCRVTKTSDTIFIRGNLTVFLAIGCSRCLENIDYTGGSDFAYTLIPRKPETKEDLELQAEDLEISYYQGDFIDLAPIVCEQVILQIPIKPLCSETCKGLCPHCGSNLNIASCNCRADFVDPRLAVLKNFKIKN